MELLSRSESREAAAAVTLEFALMSMVESVLMETILGAGKSLLWLLCMMESSQNGANLFDEGCEIIKGFPLSSLRKLKDEPTPEENKDDGESDDEDEDEDEDDAGGQDDDGGEDNYSGEEGNEEEEDEEIEANGGDGSEDEDGDEDDDDDDDDGEDEDDDEDAEDEEDDEDQPPPKKKK